MRGAPQVRFSVTIRKFKARTSLLTRFRPPTWLILETHVQYKRNPARCQFTTVLGVTKTRGCLHPDQHILNATQNSLCRAVNRRRGRCACRARQLLTQSQVFEDEVLPGTESADHPPDEMPERHDHGKNFSGKDRIKLCAKSFISHVYDLLARHNLAQVTTPSNCVQAFLRGLSRNDNLLCGKSTCPDAYSLAQRSLRQKPSMYFLEEHGQHRGRSVVSCWASHGRIASLRAV